MMNNKKSPETTVSQPVLRVILLYLLFLLFFPVLYLLMIMPSIGDRKGMKEFRKYYYAHRGLHDLSTMRAKPELAPLAKDEGRPENSLAAFRAATEAGYGIEMDVQLTKDQIPVIFHDNTLNRVCGKAGKVSDFTLKELSNFRLGDSCEKIPTLKEVLEVIGGKVPLILEYKSDNTDMTICELVDPMLRSYKGPYVIESFNPAVVFWYRKNRPEVIRGQLSGRFTDKNTLLYKLYMLPFHHLLFNFLTRPDFIAYDCLVSDAVSRRLCRKLFKNSAVAWTVHSEKELELLRTKFDLFIFEGFRP